MYSRRNDRPHVGLSSAHQGVSQVGLLGEAQNPQQRLGVLQGADGHREVLRISDLQWVHGEQREGERGGH